MRSHVVRVVVDWHVLLGTCIKVARLAATIRVLKQGQSTLVVDGVILRHDQRGCPIIIAGLRVFNGTAS